MEDEAATVTVAFFGFLFGSCDGSRFRVKGLLGGHSMKAGFVSLLDGDTTIAMIASHTHQLVLTMLYRYGSPVTSQR